MMSKSSKSLSSSKSAIICGVGRSEGSCGSLRVSSSKGGLELGTIMRALYKGFGAPFTNSSENAFGIPLALDASELQFHQGRFTCSNRSFKNCSNQYRYALCQGQNKLNGLDKFPLVLLP